MEDNFTPQLSHYSLRPQLRHDFSNAEESLRDRLAQELISLDSRLEQQALDNLDDFHEEDEAFFEKERELREATEQRIRGLEGMLAQKNEILRGQAESLL